MPRILFLAANPHNAVTLLAGDELRKIEAALKNTHFEVIAKPAAQLGDLRGLLSQYKPQIVHFSGHGSHFGELMFVDEQGNSQSAPIEALADLFRLFKSTVRCVVLNACYSDGQAAAIAEQIDCVLGFAGQIRDDAATAFSVGFYGALAEGETIATAREHGLNEIKLRYPDALNPCLIAGRTDAANLLPAEWDKANRTGTDTDAPAPGASPYKGLQFFDVEDADLFFGREQLTAELVSLLRTQRLLAVVGASGSGKSSLVRAGLVASLRRGSVPGIDVAMPKDCPQWPVYLLTPGARPLESLAAALTRNVESVTATSTLIDDLRNDPRSLHLYVTRLLSATPAKQLLIVVDQFEELFTLCRNLEEQRAFIDQLLTAALDYDRTLLVLTLRADFYASCARFEKLRNALDQYQKYIGPMSRAELQRTIEEPARRGQWTLESELVQELLDDVGDEPGSLPLLSHALNESWKRRHGRQLRLADYVGIGGVKGAIAQTAEAIFNDFSEEQQTIARAIFLRLTALGEGVQDTRRRIDPSELQLQAINPAVVRDVLTALADARLVTTDAHEVQVTHEAVIREWPRLRQWLGADREGQRIHRHLSESAKEWVARGQDRNDLYRGNRLSQAQEWAAEASIALNQQEADFLQASLAESEAQAAREQTLAAEREATRQRELENERRLAEEQGRRARLARIALIVVTFLLIGASVAGFLAYRSSITSQRLAMEALSSSYLNEGSRIFGPIESATSTDEKQNPYSPLLGLRLGAEGLAVTPNDHDALHEQLKTAVGNWAKEGRMLSFSGKINVSSTGDRFVFYHGNSAPAVWQMTEGKTTHALHDDVESSEWSPDGGSLLTTYFSASPSELWRAADDAIVKLADDVDSAQWSPDGNYLVARYTNVTSELLGLHDGSVVKLPGRVSHTGWSPDGAFFLVQYFDKPAEVRWVANDHVVDLAAGILDVNPASWATDGNHFIVDYQNAPAELRSPTNNSVIKLTGLLDWVSWSPDGNLFMVQYMDAAPELRQAADGTLVELTSRLNWVSWSPDGSRFIVNYQNVPAELRSATNHSVVELAGRLNWVSWSPDGNLFIAQYIDTTPELRQAADGAIVALSNSDAFAPLRTMWWSPDNTFFIANYDYPTPAEVRRVDNDSVVNLASGLQDILWSPDNTFFIADYDYPTPAELRRVDNDAVVPLAGMLDTIWWSPDGSRFIVDYAVNVFGELRREEDDSVVKLTDAVKSVWWSADSSLVLVEYERAPTELWLVKEENRLLLKLASGIDRVAFTANGRRLLLQYSDQRTYLLNLDWIFAVGPDPANLTDGELLNRLCSGPFASPLMAQVEEKFLAYLYGRKPVACQ